jgi:hypothetical protein
VRLSGLIAILALWAVGAATSAAAQAGHSEPGLVFPIVIDAPKSISTRSVPNGEAAFVQTFRSAAVVRLNTAYDLKPSVGPKVALSEGTRLVLARRGDEELFCAPASSGARDIILNGNFEVCFRDVDHDGVFDGQMLTASMARAQTPYEMGSRGWPAWSPASIAYTKLAMEDVPAGEIRVRYVFHKPRIGVTGAWSELRICAPAALSLSGADTGPSTRCGALVEPGIEQLYRDRVWLDRKKPEGLAVAFGPIKAVMKVNADGSADTDVSESFPAGPALMLLAATYGAVMDPASRMSIFAILPVREGA